MFLPGLFRSGQRDFDRCRFSSLQPQEELGVLHPGEGIRLSLELLIVEMAATGTALFPLGGKHDVAAILQLLHFNGLRRVDCQCEVGGEGVALGGGHDDEGTLRGLVESVKGGNVVALVGSFLVPLIGQNL